MVSPAGFEEWEMKTAVVFFSLTGNTWKVADMLKVGDTDLVRLKRRSSLLSMLGLGLKPKFDPHKYDLIVIGCPVWGGSPAKPFMAALRRMDFAGRQVNIYLTYGQNQDKALKMVADEVKRRNGQPGRTMAFEMSKPLSETEVRKLLSF